jgi:hypothetical protein
MLRGLDCRSAKQVRASGAMGRPQRAHLGKLPHSCPLLEGRFGPEPTGRGEQLSPLLQIRPSCKTACTCWDTPICISIGIIWEGRLRIPTVLDSGQKPGEVTVRIVFQSPGAASRLIPPCPSVSPPVGSPQGGVRSTCAPGTGAPVTSLT